MILFENSKRFYQKKWKIGHSGTLDPFATGLVIIGIGKEFTKQLNLLQNKDKKYQATITLGAETDSYDLDGTITYEHEGPSTVSQQEILTALQSFKGVSEQLPPKFSAKKINGTPAYKLARKGTDFELKTSEINIYDISLDDYVVSPNPTIITSIHCSKGTYIRTIAHDLGKKLNVGGYLTKLNRTGIGNIGIEASIPLENISQNTIESQLINSIPLE